jgi:nitrate/TMAO reductase-like tetraheme cytochrome c subunit
MTWSPAVSVVLAVPIALALLLAPAPAPAGSGGFLNPHAKPESCPSCHTKVPTPEEAAAGNYFMLKESIDATCHICHKKVCCDINSLHMFNHRSDFKDWDPKKYKSPKTLPLQNGFITCATCHFHSQQAESAFRMVRLAKRTQSQIEWSGLCKDCHEDK